MDRDYYDSEDMLLMDYVEDAYAAGLDVTDYSTFEELFDDLHNTPTNYSSGSYGSGFSSGGAGVFPSNPVSSKPAAKEASRAPYFPPEPKPPEIGILFPIYIIAMALLLLGALVGLTGYGRGDDWTGWAAFIGVAVFLFILPICLKISWYRDDMKCYEQKKKTYKKK